MGPDGRGASLARYLWKVLQGALAGFALKTLSAQKGLVLKAGMRGPGGSPAFWKVKGPAVGGLPLGMAVGMAVEKRGQHL